MIRYIVFSPLTLLISFCFAIIANRFAKALQISVQNDQHTPVKSKTHMLSKYLFVLYCTNVGDREPIISISVTPVNRNVSHRIALTFNIYFISFIQSNTYCHLFIIFHCFSLFPLLFSLLQRLFSFFRFSLTCDRFIFFTQVNITWCV